MSWAYCDAYCCACYSTMALNSVVLVTLVLLVSPAVSSLSVVKGSFGASVTLPCNGSAYRGTSDDQLDVLWQTSEGEKVAHYSGGIHSVGLQFEQRVAFLTERIQRGDFSLTISSVDFRDEDTYECVWRKGQDGEKFLRDVKLYVLVPFFLKSMSVSAGDPVVLPCFGHVTKKARDDELFVQWKKDDDVILQVSSGDFTHRGTFTNRASMSLDMIQRGDFSLSLSITASTDQGTYQCSTDRNQTATSVSLEVRDHHTNFIAEPGMTFNLSVPRVPVKVLFFKDGSHVSVCKALGDYASCEPDYIHRMAYKEGTLLLRSVMPSDEGRYAVMYGDDIIIKEVSLKVNSAFPKVLYGLTLLVSVSLLVLVMRRLGYGLKEVLGSVKLCVNLIKKRFILSTNFHGIMNS